MKYIVVSALLPLAIFASAIQSSYLPEWVDLRADCDVVLHKKAFDICYDCEGKIPKMVIYSTKKDLIDARNIERKGLRFRPDYQLPIRCRSYPRDYSRTGYDRGHLAPNAIFDYSRTIQKETFLMSNIAPQKPLLNRRLWAKVERYVRMATRKYSDLSVITGVCGGKGRLKNGVRIPKYWYKILFYPNGKSVGFLAPNTNENMRWAKLRYTLISPLKIAEICNFKLQLTKSR